MKILWFNNQHLFCDGAAVFVLMCSYTVTYFVDGAK